MGLTWTPSTGWTTDARYREILARRAACAHPNVERLEGVMFPWFGFPYEWAYRICPDCGERWDE
jgi:hypothetical protein